MTTLTNGVQYEPPDVHQLLFQLVLVARVGGLSAFLTGVGVITSSIMEATLHMLVEREQQQKAGATA